jgi:hypothetical protein
LKCASCRKTSRPKLISTSESAAHLGTRNRLRQIAQQFQNWLKNRCEKWRVPVLDAPEGRRDDFVDPYFKQAKTDEERVCRWGVFQCSNLERWLPVSGTGQIGTKMH